MPLIKTDPIAQHKTPDEVVKRDIDFAGDELAIGETVSSVLTSGVDPAGELAISATSISGTKVQLTFTGGVAGKVYKVFVRVATSLGQTLDGQGIMSVDTR